MSTPKTDAACGWPWGYHGRIESSDLKLSPDGPFVHSSVAREVERENAALRKDKERLDWLDHNAIPWNWLSPELIDGLGPIVVTWKSNRTLRDAIDAARKEAKP